MEKKPILSLPKQQDRSHSTTRSTLQVLIGSAKTLASDQNVDRILERFDRTVDLDAEVNSKEERIKALRAELEKQRTNHEITHQQSLLTYEASRDRVRSQLESSETNVVSLRSELEQGNALLEALKSKNASLTNTIHNLTKSGKVQDEKARKFSLEMKTLQDSLRASEDANEKSKAVLHQQETQISRLEGDFKRLQNDYEAVVGQHRSTTQQLSDIRSLTVSLSNEDPEPTFLKLERVWSAASELVCSTFLEDIPEIVMQNDALWQRLRQPRYWEHTLPIPQSNSMAAKQMRIVVILASLARAIDMHIFQPTYFLPTNANIRDLLTRQAQENSRKESAFRAMMQAVLPKEQGTAATTRANQVCEEMMLDTGAFLSHEATAKFKDNLEDIIEDARDIWQEIGLSIYAVQPSFALQQYENWSWRGFRFQEVQPLVESDTQAVSLGRDEPVCAIFPRLYMFDEDGEDPVTHGTVLMRSQTLAAREEMQQHPSSPGMGRSNSILAKRPKKSRKPSTSGKSSNDEGGSKSFLGRRSWDQS